MQILFIVLLFFDFREANGFNRGNFQNPLDHLIRALDKHFVEGIPIRRIARFRTVRAKIFLCMYSNSGKNLFC